MKKSEDELVVLFPTDVQEEGTIHELPDPFSGEMRRYWKYGTTFYELNTIQDDDDDKYSAFCMGNNILASNKLHVSTPVDPLFWLVYFCTSQHSTTTTSTAWQPLEQLLQTVCGSYYTLLSECLLVDTAQCQHVLATLPMDDDVYYKFCPTTTLAWLTRKQQNVLAVLCQRRNERESQADATCGAFVEGFVLGGVENNEAANQNDDAMVVAAESKSSSSTKDHPDDVTASYQLIGNYVSANLREQWTTHLGLEQERIWGGTCTKNSNDGGAKKAKTTVTATPSAEEWNAAALGRSATETTKVVNNKPKAVTMGAKRLQKVNKRGMQKMSAFFSTKKK